MGTTVQLAIGLVALFGPLGPFIGYSAYRFDRDFPAHKQDADRQRSAG